MKSSLVRQLVELERGFREQGLDRVSDCPECGGVRPGTVGSLALAEGEVAPECSACGAVLGPDEKPLGEWVDVVTFHPRR